MSDERNYYDSLIAQGYPPHEALSYTHQYFPDFQNIESVFDAPNVAPPTPIVEQQYVQQPEQFIQQPVMVMPAQDSSSKTILYVVGGISIAVVGLVILSGLLYVWASSLATQENEWNNIEGTWYNPVQTFTFSSNGDLEDNATTFVEWRVEGNNLYFVDSTDPGYEYYFRYSISNDVLFLAPLDYDLVTVVGEDCSAYTRDRAGKDLDEYTDLVVRVEWPDWCTPEE